MSSSRCGLCSSQIEPSESREENDLAVLSSGAARVHRSHRLRFTDFVPREAITGHTEPQRGYWDTSLMSLRAVRPARLDVGRVPQQSLTSL